jgi:hypothetical protein
VIGIGVPCMLLFMCLVHLFCCFQGVKPLSYEKVENPEIKDIIEHCIRPRKEDR